MMIKDHIRYIGVNDHKIDLFEGQYRVPNGMSYNSYLILDEKIAVMDTADIRFAKEWLGNLKTALEGKEPDYLVIQHMEPDHSGSILEFLEVYPEAAIVSNAQAFAMMDQFFTLPENVKKITVDNGQSLSLGSRTLTFVFAPMVHWPEVMVTYDAEDKILFSADGFGKFGANDVDEPWDDEARRYYIGIVGKYGEQVQKLLKAAAGLDIEMICPLHGPVLKEDLGHYIHLYDLWSSYEPETEGVMIAYTSVYGHTKEAALLMARKLEEKGCPNTVIYDLARCDMAKAVGDAFRFSKLVLATTTYNAEIYPFMKEFIDHLTERGFRKRTVAVIENGSWAPAAAKIMKEMLSGCEKICWVEPVVTIRSAMKKETEKAIDKAAAKLCGEYIALSSEKADKGDMKALFRIGYGLYVVTTNDGTKDNGCIVNTVTQLTSSPNRVAVNINKQNYTHDIVKKTGKLNVNCLSVEAPFSVFQHYGFQSGKNTDKFAGQEGLARSDNGLVILSKYANAVLCLTVENYMDLGTHGMFICSVSEARVISDKETMTYNYYQANVKPKPETSKAKGYVCTVCGYVYEGDELPPDFVCPLCKHGAADFEKIS